MANLAQLLLDDLGPNFPISTGNAKVDDPLVITAAFDHVGVEYAVARHVLGMMQEEYALAEQRVRTNSDRIIDELVFDVKPVGTDDWTGRRRFFFDITAGYGSSDAA
jgi:hypothetical protein